MYLYHGYFLWSRFIYGFYNKTEDSNKSDFILNIRLGLAVVSTQAEYTLTYSYLNPTLLDSVPSSSLQIAARVGLGAAVQFANSGVLSYAPQNTGNNLVENPNQYLWTSRPRAGNAPPFQNNHVVDTFNRPRLLPLLLSAQNGLPNSKPEYTQLILDRQSSIGIGRVLVEDKKGSGKLIVFIITIEQYNQHPEYLSSGMIDINYILVFIRILMFKNYYLN